MKFVTYFIRKAVKPEEEKKTGIKDRLLKTVKMPFKTSLRNPNKSLEQSKQAARPNTYLKDPTSNTNKGESVIFYLPERST